MFKSLYLQSIYTTSVVQKNTKRLQEGADASFALWSKHLLIGTATVKNNNKIGYKF